MRDTVSISSGRTLLMSPRMMPEKPSRMPTTGMPSTHARMVAAPITLLMPGAGPPPTRIAILLSVMDPQPRLCPNRHSLRRRGRLSRERRLTAEPQRPQSAQHDPAHTSHTAPPRRELGLALCVVPRQFHDAQRRNPPPQKLPSDLCSLCGSAVNLSDRPER